METKHDLELARFILRQEITDLRARCAAAEAVGLRWCPVCRVCACARRALSGLRRGWRGRGRGRHGVLRSLLVAEGQGDTGAAHAGGGR